MCSCKLCCLLSTFGGDFIWKDLCSLVRRQADVSNFPSASVRSHRGVALPCALFSPGCSTVLDLRLHQLLMTTARIHSFRVRTHSCVKNSKEFIRKRILSASSSLSIWIVLRQVCSALSQQVALHHAEYLTEDC